MKKPRNRMAGEGDPKADAPYYAPIVVELFPKRCISWSILTSI
jgi:hypothetical protein